MPCASVDPSIAVLTIPYWASHGLAWLAILLLVLTTRRLFHTHRTQTLNLIGSLHHRSIHDLLRNYGPIMQLQFGTFPVIVASSADMAREFVKTHDAVLASRPEMASGKYTIYDSSHILWSPNGLSWRQAHKMFRTELFSAKRVESFEYIRAEEMKSTLRCLFELTGEDIVLKSCLSDLSLNIISRMVLGRKYSEQSHDNPIVTPEELRKMMDELSFLNGALNISDSIPWQEIFDHQGYIKQMKALGKKFTSFCRMKISPTSVQSKHKYSKKIYL